MIKAAKALTRRRTLFAVVLAITIFGAVYGFAATLNVGSNTLSAGNVAVASCQATGTPTGTYTTAYDSTIPGYKVASVIVTGLDNTNCSGKADLGHPHGRDRRTRTCGTIAGTVPCQRQPDPDPRPVRFRGGRHRRQRRDQRLTTRRKFRTGGQSERGAWRRAPRIARRRTRREASQQGTGIRTLGGSRVHRLRRRRDTRDRLDQAVGRERGSDGVHLLPRSHAQRGQQRERDAGERRRDSDGVLRRDALGHARRRRRTQPSAAAPPPSAAAARPAPSRSRASARPSRPPASPATASD